MLPGLMAPVCVMCRIKNEKKGEDDDISAAHISVYLIYQRARRAHVFDNGLGLCSSAVSTLVATR